MSEQQRLACLKRSFVGRACGYPYANSSTTSAGAPWASPHKIDPVPLGALAWPRETLLSQFTLPILPAAAVDLLQGGFDLEVAAADTRANRSAPDKAGMVSGQSPEGISMQHTSGGGATDVYVRCNLCMCSVKTSNVHRDPKHENRVPVEWKDTYFGNIVRHVVSAKHHLAISSFLKGHLQGQRFVAKHSDARNGSDDEAAGDMQPSTLSIEYERLLKYIKWRELLLLDVNKAELKQLGGTGLTSDCITPATQRAFSRLGDPTEEEGDVEGC
jgi:hypothetical protein